MKKYSYPEAIREAVRLEYQRPAPETLRLTVRQLMQLPLIKPWQLMGSVALLLLSPLAFYLIGSRPVYSTNTLLVINTAAGAFAFLLIFAGVAHHYSNPKHKAELVDKLNALRTRF